jgi:hypothetical protein
VEIVRWVAESQRPFQIVKDRGFRNLMKMGRPDYYIPSGRTVSRDVKNVFVNVRRAQANGEAATGEHEPLLQICGLD